MLALANLRERWPSVLAAFLALVAGVALTSATLLVATSARPPVQPRLAGTAALATPDTAIPWTAAAAAGVRDRLAAVPGITDAVIDRSFYAQAVLNGRPVGDPHDDEAGHGWSSTRLAPLPLTAGTPPSGPRDVVVDRALGVPVGATVAVNTAPGLADFRVSGTVDGPGFYLTDDEAARRSPGVRTIGILGSVSPDALTRTLGADGSVLTGAARGAVEPEYVAHQRYLAGQILVATVLLGLFTTVFVVSSTLALAVAQRGRELGLLRTVGATPRQIRRMVLGEGLVLGLVGGLVGCVAGIGLAPVLHGVLRALRAAPRGMTLHVTPAPLLGALAVGAVVAMIGMGLASRTASRVRPLAALSDGSATTRPVGRGRVVAGVVVLGGGVVLAVLTAVAGSDTRLSTALGTAMAFIAAAALLAPVIIGPVVRGVTAPLARRSGSATTMLVRAEVLAGTRRAAATAAPVIAAVGFAVVISGTVQTMATAYPASQTQLLAGQVVVDSRDVPGLGEDAVAAVGAPPGTRAPLPTTLVVEHADGARSVVDGVGQADPAIGPDEVVLSTPAAATLGTAAGRTLAVWFADGTTAPLRVRAVLPPDPTRGDIALARTTVRAHDPDALVSSVFLPPGSIPRSSPPGATVQDARAYALADYAADARLSEGLGWLLVVISVGYSGLAVANGMAMAAHGRRADVAVLAAVGATARQRLTFALAETALVVLVGVALGAAVTVPPLLAMAAGLAEETGTDVGLQLDGGVVAAAGGGCLVLALLASAAVSGRTGRRRTS